MNLTITINVNWSALMPQFAECLQDIKDFGYTKQEITTILNDRYNWTEHPIFRREVFNFENARFTLTQLCNTVELLTGNDMSFSDELRSRMLSLVREEVAA